MDSPIKKTNHEHSHGINLKVGRVGALATMITLNLSFFLVELVIGNISKSNSLVADSFHMLSDLVSFVVALVAIKISHLTNPERNTYGWVRAEVLGSLINAVFLLSLCLSIVIESIKRFFEPQNLEQIN
ncbi:Zinc transporter 1, partial [Brachionus plicatilis]